MSRGLNKAMEEAREKLIEVVGKVETRKMDLGSAKVINNGVGKVIKYHQEQLKKAVEKFQTE